ncbi:Envelope glycoprotein gp160, partial [Frankliniella fusca]
MLKGVLLLARPALAAAASEVAMAAASAPLALAPAAAPLGEATGADERPRGAGATPGALVAGAATPAGAAVATLGAGAVLFRASLRRLRSSRTRRLSGSLRAAAGCTMVGWPPVPVPAPPPGPSPGSRTVSVVELWMMVTDSILGSGVLVSSFALKYCGGETKARVQARHSTR